MSTGQGIAGILMNFIQYLVLFFIGDIDIKNTEQQNDNIIKKGGIVFFSISVIIILICLGFIIKIYNNKYFKKQLISSGEYNSNIDNVDKLIPNLENEINETNLNEPQNYKSNDEISFIKLTKLLLDINILTSLLYIGTFSVFPVCCFQFTLFKLTEGYNINTIGTLFNIFDTIGRSISSYFNPTKKLIYFVVLSRFILLFLIPLNYYFHIEKDNNISFTSSIFVLFLILLSITNGLGTSLVFSIALTLVPEYVKGKAGSSVSFYLILGIFLGTICGFGMNLIMDFIDNKNKK
jgi:MFS family permease